MPKSLVLLSGGMDSATLLAQCLHEGQEVYAVSFDYGQRHNKELHAAMGLTRHYEVEHIILDLKGAAAAFAGSALTGNGDIPHGHYADDSMKKTIVPNRNMTMLSLAAGLAIAKKLDYLMYAAHAGDHHIYEDCRPVFFEAVKSAIELADANPPKVFAPFIHWTKTDIARNGYTLNVPFELTWSCYTGGKNHCGLCGTCVERREAFQEAGIPDPTNYETTIS